MGLPQNWWVRKIGLLAKMPMNQIPAITIHTYKNHLRTRMENLQYTCMIHELFEKIYK